VWRQTVRARTRHWTECSRTHWPGSVDLQSISDPPVPCHTVETAKQETPSVQRNTQASWQGVECKETIATSPQIFRMLLPKNFCPKNAKCQDKINPILAKIQVQNCNFEPPQPPQSKICHCLSELCKKICSICW